MSRWNMPVLCLSLSTLVLAQEPTLKASLHRTFAGHSEVVRQVVFSPDGQVLATGSVDRTQRTIDCQRRR